MTPWGFRSRFDFKVIPILIFFWSVILTDHVNCENVEIVTPENSKPTTEPPPRVNVTVNWASNDSYLQAYKYIRRTRPAKRNDVTDYGGPSTQPYNTVIRSTYLPDDGYPSLTHEHRVPPRPVYGPVYHSHHHEELPTRPWHQMPYSSPSTSFLSFLPKKLSLKLILKIILKLVLFKMIVKFIAVLCLLLFIPSLKSKETEPESDGYEKRRARQMDLLSSLVWDSLDSKKWAYGEEEEMEDIREIAEEADSEPESSGSESAVRFLQFCVSTVDRAVGYILGYLRKQNGEGETEDLSSFIWDKFHGLVEGM